MEQPSRHLNFNKFVQDRSEEINRFLVELAMATKKKGHQALPKSVRRRAMSHNRFRIPRKLRRQIQPELIQAQSLQKIPKCRKHIRKRRHLITAYQLRNSKYRWLSTHLWSAKRMRMQHYFGYKIAYTPNDKCFRSAYRHFRHNCCLVDLSYLQCLSITLGVCQLLPKNIEINNKSNINSFTQLHFGKLYQTPQKLTLITPLILIKTLHPSNNTIIYRCLFHPACTNSLYTLSFQGDCHIHLQANQTDIYLLLGPQYPSILHKAIKQYGLQYQNQLNTFRFYNTHIQYLVSGQPQIVKTLITPPIHEELQVKPRYNVNENIRIRQTMLQIYAQTNQKQQIDNHAMKKFWQCYELGQNKNLQQTVLKITTRSRYTHKRKNKLSKQQKKKMGMLQPKIKKTTLEKEVNEAHEQGKKDTTINQSEMKDEQKQQLIKLQTQIQVIQPPKQQPKTTIPNPLLIACHNSSSTLQSCLIMASNEDNCRFWRIMTHLNVKVIGRRQYQHIMLETGVRVFPKDYPETKAFEVFQMMRYEDNLEKLVRMPKKKRPQYRQCNSQFPLYIPWQPQQKVLMISLLMVSRGQCFEGSYLCQLIRQDIDKISTQLELGKIGTVCRQQQPQQPTSEPLQTLSPPPNLSQQITSLTTLTPIRQIIGFVTSGGYLFSKCQQGGIGFLNNSQAEAYLQTYKGYILVRKPTSPHYRLAIAQLLLQ